MGRGGRSYPGRESADRRCGWPQARWSAGDSRVKRRRHAALRLRPGTDPTNRARDCRGRTLVSGADRQIDDNSASGLPPPSLCKCQDFCALHRVELAAIGANENFECMIGFRHRDRVTLAIIGRNVGNSGNLLIGVAGADEKRKSGDDVRREQPAPALARLPAIICLTVCIVVSLRAECIERLSRG